MIGTGLKELYMLLAFRAVELSKTSRIDSMECVNLVILESDSGRDAALSLSLSL